MLKAFSIILLVEDFGIPSLVHCFQDVRILPPSLPETNPLSAETKVYPAEVTTHWYYC